MKLQEIKKKIDIAMAAVADLEEPFKSEAFGVILSKLLEPLAMAKVTEPVSPVRIDLALETRPPQISGTKSCREAIFKLMSSDWGKKPRTMREITDAMKLSAVYYQDPVVSTELRRMTKLGMLRRLKSSEKGYEYVIARPT